MNDHAIRRDRNAIMAVLVGYGAKFHGNACRCVLPGHSDRDPSAGIFEGTDGVWRFKCQKCDNKPFDIFDIEAEMSGKDVKQILREASGLPEPSGHAKRETAPQTPTYASVESAEQNDYSIKGFVAKYKYADWLYVYRIPKAGGGKRFCPLHRRSDGMWVAKKPSGKLPLYANRAMTNSDKFVFVEGEKCVDILGDIHIPAVTSMGGAGASKDGDFDWSVLSGKTGYVWPDNDADGTGEAHALRVIAHIQRAGGSATMVDISGFGLPLKGDVEQYLAAFDTRKEKVEALRRALVSEKPTGIEVDMIEIVEREHRGEGLPVNWPWRSFNQNTQFSTPGTVSLIVAPPASSKSFALIEAASFWCDEDVPFALYELEDKCAMHSFRALAQRMRQPGLTRPEWRAAHAAEVKDAIGDNAAFLRKLNRQMYGQTDQTPTKDSLLKWMKARAEERPRIILVDPITARKSGRDQWLDDEDFVDGIKRIVDAHPDINITLVSHPKKGSTEPHLDNIAGGASFSRLLHKVIWIQSAYPSVKSLCKDSMVTMEKDHNRTWHALKLRDMPGTGMKIAMNFSSADLRFYECGVIVGKEEQKRGSISTFEQRAINSKRITTAHSVPVEETYEDGNDDLF